MEQKHQPSIAPTILAGDLVLRAHRADDHAACLMLWSDPEVVRFIGGVPSTAEDVWARILRYAGHWALMGYGYWVIETRTGAFVGEVGFADFRRETNPSMGGAPELGYALLPAFQGRGLATRAAGAALAWVRQACDPARTVCLINPEHRSSIRVAEKLGYANPTRLTYRGREQVLLERLEASGST